MNLTDTHKKRLKRLKKVIFFFAILILSFMSLFLRPENFKTTVAKELGMKKSDIGDALIGKAYEKDVHSYRNLSLVGTISSSERDRLLNSWTPYTACDKPCQNGGWFIPIETSDIREDAIARLKSSNPRCATKTILEPGVRTGADQVCLASDSNMIWYTSTMSTLGL